jgi:hypothetical protein
MSTYLDCGIVLFTNRKIAFSDGSCMRFLMIHMNCATDMSLGTRNLRLSISGICELGTFSTTTLNRTLMKAWFTRLHRLYSPVCVPGICYVFSRLRPFSVLQMARERNEAARLRVSKKLNTCPTSFLL